MFEDKNNVMYTLTQINYTLIHFNNTRSLLSGTKLIILLMLHIRGRPKTKLIILQKVILIYLVNVIKMSTFGYSKHILGMHTVVSCGQMLVLG